jgi:hypothetical protein
MRHSHPSAVGYFAAGMLMDRALQQTATREKQNQTIRRQQAFNEALLKFWNNDAALVSGFNNHLTLTVNTRTPELNIWIEDLKIAADTAAKVTEMQQDLQERLQNLQQTLTQKNDKK